MMLDRYHFQREIKSRNRRKIVSILKDSPSTFTELLDGAKLSRPVLAQYLKELVKDEVIERRIHDERIVYELTQRGKASELMRTRALASGFRAATSLIRDERTAELFANMLKMAREKPEFFRVLMDWMLDFTLFMTSDPVYESRWIRVLSGNQDEWRPFRDEIAKRIPTSLQIDTPEKLREMLDSILEATKAILLREKGRKKA